MNWISLAIIAHFFWALVNLGDKYFLSKRVENPYVYNLTVALFGGFLGMCATVWFVEIVDLNIFLLVFFSGMLWVFGGFPYAKAMQIEEPTRINVWWSLIPLFSLLLSVLFLGDVFTGMQLVSFLILISASIVASLHVQKKKFHFSQAFVYMFFACFAFASLSVILEYVYRIASFIETFFYFSSSIFLFSAFFLVLPKFYRPWKKEIIANKKTLLPAIAIIAIIDLIGLFFNQWAISIGPVAFVFSLEVSQVLFVFFIATALSIFFPHIIKEDLDRKNVLVKIAALLLMMSGIFLLAITF